MIVSARERAIVWATAGVLGLFAADSFLLTPVLDRRTRIDAETADCVADLQKADRLFAQKRRLAPRWREMTDAGLGTGAGAAESRVLNSLRDWAQEATLSLGSVKLERTEMERQFQKITWRATGTGSMESVGKFIHRIQRASMPIRVSDLQVAARQEGKDSLTIQVGVSTLCMVGGAERETPPGDRAPAEVPVESPAPPATEAEEKS